jgi:transposase
MSITVEERRIRSLFDRAETVHDVARTLRGDGERWAKLLAVPDAALAEEDTVHRLPVSTKSAYQWRRRWRAGARRHWRRKALVGRVCRLSGAQLGRLRAALDGGPAFWGWDEDQRWTLARATTLIARLFHIRYTLRGTLYLLHRLGYAPQVPIHRAAERDEKAIAAWRTTTWAGLRG